MKHCPNCNTEHSKTGIYCSRPCANRRIHSTETREKLSKSISLYRASHPVERPKKVRVCCSCNNEFTDTVRKGRIEKCLQCRKKQLKVDINNVSSILMLSTRTVSKILKRSKNTACSMCGWNETSLDIHHIKPKAKGGSDDHSNLIIVCPNCHRKAHEGKYSIEELKQKCLLVYFPDWKSYYNPDEMRTESQADCNPAGTA